MGVSVPYPKIIGYGQVSTTARVAIAANIPIDDTIPQQTEGTEVLTLAYTAKNPNSKLEIEVTGYASTYGSGFQATGALFKDATANAIAATIIQGGRVNDVGQPFTLRAVVPAVDVSAHTFKFRAGASSGTVEICAQDGARIFGGTCYCQMTIKEIAP